MFKLVVVGPGLIGKKHIQLIHQNPNSTLVSIVAPDHEVNHEISKNNNVPLYFSLEECFENCVPDGVIVSSPNSFHSDQAKLCIQNNIPVLIEKPVTSSLDEGRGLLKMADKYGAKVLVGHHRTYSPLMETSRNLIKSGVLGELVSIIGSAQFLKPKHYFLEGPWRSQIGGGPILINLIHEIGNLRSLMGEIKAVQAVSSSKIRKFLVEDTVAINFVFENGALGTFLLSDTAATAKSWEQTTRENPSYPYYSDEDCYTVAGTKGSLAIPSMRLKYYSPDVDPSWWNVFTEEVVSVERIDPLSRQLSHFLDVISGTAIPQVSIADGFKNLLITDAIKNSALNGKMIYIEDCL